MDGEFWEWEEDIAKFDASLDARVHIVGATGGVDGDLDVFKLSDGWRVGVFIDHTIAMRVTRFVVVAKLNSKSSGGVSIR